MKLTVVAEETGVGEINLSIGRGKGVDKAWDTENTQAK